MNENINGVCCVEGCGKPCRVTFCESCWKAIPPHMKRAYGGRGHLATGLNTIDINARVKKYLEEQRVTRPE